MKQNSCHGGHQPERLINRERLAGEDFAQFERAVDLVTCAMCSQIGKLEVYPELGTQMWDCPACGKGQVWSPSKEFNESYSYGTSLLSVPKNKISTNPNIKMGKLTLDALAKMDRGDVEKMTSSDALEALVACDTAAGSLNETIGIAAQKGYNREFLSGVMDDIGKLRNLKQLLHDKLEQEVV